MYIIIVGTQYLKVAGAGLMQHFEFLQRVRIAISGSKCREGKKTLELLSYEKKNSAHTIIIQYSYRK